MTDSSPSALTEEQQVLFARLLNEEGFESPADEGIPRIDRNGELSLSYAQQRLWFLYQFGSDQGMYNIPGVLRMKGALNIEALRRALARIVDRHEALRTSVVERSGKPVQKITMPAGLAVGFFDLHDKPQNCQDLIRELALEPFDLGRSPMIRATVIRVNADDHLLVLVMHHIASDGWSLGVFAKELGQFYGAFNAGRELSLPEPPIQYADFAAWQRTWLAGEREERQLDYWRVQLSGAPDLELPMARARPPVRSLGSEQVTFKIPRRLSKAMEELAQQQGSTPFMVGLTVFKTLLHRYSGQTDIVVGAPIAGRVRRETEELIGFFVNTQVMRSDFSGNPSFEEALRRVRETALAAYANQDVPFDRLVIDLKPDRQTNKSPLFQAMFTLESGAAADWNLMGLETEWDEGVSGQEKFDLSLELRTRLSGMQGVLAFRTDIFDANAMSRIASHFVTLLESICSDPKAQVADLEILSAGEREQVVKDWNQTHATFSAGTLHGLAEAQASKTPERVAICHGTREVSYYEINAQANQLARYLQVRGVGIGSCVGVCLERTADMVIALLSVLKAGGAYVALDPEYPLDRLRFMVNDSAASVVLTQASVAPRLRGTGADLVMMDGARTEIMALPSDSLDVPITGTNAAYVIYTSGSTGRPKGVVIEHRSAVTLMHWARSLHSHEELAGMLASTSICFDLSVYEIFLPLCWGGTVFVAKNALHLPSLEHRESVRIVNTVPSAITELVRLNAVPDGVLTVNLAGEALKRTLVNRIYERTNVRRVINLYGPSEDTTYSTFIEVERGAAEEVTIGRPIANTRAYVLDSRLRPLPIGIAGELYLAGDGLARGYLNRPELTAERFVPDPFSESGGRMYSTGDRAAWQENGEIRFLGRLDLQVKIRGYRIELGEIEAALREQPSVAQVAVLAREDDPGQKRLVGYVTAKPDLPSPGAGALRDALLRRLPEYMVPSIIVELDEMPLTPNGKLDRQKLPAPGVAQPEAQYVAPATATQEVLAGIWAELLGVDRIGTRDNFFRAGGHSLLATQVISRVREVLRIDAPLRDIFEAPTIDEFSKALARRELKLGQTERIATIFKQVRAMSAAETAVKQAI